MKDEGKRPIVDLRVRAKDFALLIIKMYVALPKSAEAQVLGKQVLRSEHLSGQITAKLGPYTNFNCFSFVSVIPLTTAATTRLRPFFFAL